MPPETTPMMQQYLRMKELHPDCILFFRLGDFYEMFNEDAKLVSKELELTLTSRDRGKPEAQRTPMCGVPYHSADAYIARLIAKGYKVAICEQMEDPALAKGLVDRDIIRIITPGTLIDSSMLEEGKNNYIGGVYADSRALGLCLCDISTGEFYVTSFPAGAEAMDHLKNELGRFSPREAVLSDGAWSLEGLPQFLRERLDCRCENGGEARFRYEAALPLVQKQFRTGLDSLPPEDQACVQCAGGLLSYLYETQKTDLSHLSTLTYFTTGQFMELDLTARRNLELTETLRSKEKKGSLLWVLDKTRTAMGHRLIRAWMERPLLSPAAIGRRLGAVGELVGDAIGREELTLTLREITDLERLIGRIVYGTAGGRDLVALANGLGRLPALRERLAGCSSALLASLREELDDLTELRELIGRAIVDEPPFSVREGGFIRAGYHPEVDRLRDIMNGGAGTIAAIEGQEREKTGIRTLKIGYNKVFGYYIEVSNSFKELVPETYIRKQTLVNGERYITQELKDLEHDILSASDRDAALEYELFTRLRQTLCDAVTRVQGAAAVVAELDCLCSLAAVAVKNNYCCPVVDESGVIEIHDGRHPVVECMRPDAMFVPNDTYMGEKENRAAIITGPNMAGKSTYMRQVALMVLMAQIGSFVPAKAARIGIVDRIFTRIGASDDLSAGQSTFMVEMTEVSDILRCATSRSLLILDEIGRGTSTFDGMSIARAVLEYCADPKKLGAKTLFATHYHELTAMEGTLPGVKNYNIAVKTRGEDIIFLRKIIPGGADRSYGIEVARLAGLPSTVVNRAKKILRQLEEEAGRPAPAVQAQEDQVSLTALSEGEVIDQLRRTQVDTLSPLEALNLLYELKKKLS